MLRTERSQQDESRSSFERDLRPRGESTCISPIIRLFLWVSGVVGMTLLYSTLSSEANRHHDDSYRGLITSSVEFVTGVSIGQVVGAAPSFAADTARQPPVERYRDGQARRERRAAACHRMKSDRDIRDCYPKKIVKQFSDPECAAIEDWDDVQRCLTGRFQYDRNSTIREIHVVGERNSGTKFVTNSVQHCFPKSTGVMVHRDFLRGKHFFQPIVQGDFSSSLVIVVVRDPIDWVAAMRESPYHSPSHIARFDNVTGTVIPLPWNEFVRKPWTTSHTQWDRKLATTSEVRRQPICRQHFTMEQVVPCRSDNQTAQGPPWNIPLRKWRGYEPIYELRRDGSGKPFDTLLQLRSDKIVNWILQLPLILQIGGFIAVRYEDLLEYGNESLLQRIAEIVADGASTNLPAACNATGPQPERIGRRQVPEDIREWINYHVDPKTEKLVGYR